MGNFVGIDLGTTNSAIAFTELGRQRCARIEENRFASAVMPSCVGVFRGELRVGAEACNLREHVREFKRNMGEDTAYELGGRMYTPIELSAMVLRKLKEGFERRHGAIEGAVVTVPAMFNERQRRDTREAGRLAGLNVLRVINEPSAAAIAYSVQESPPGGDSLVIDWGGGTLDVSIMDGDPDVGVLDVKANGGDTRLGGKDVDEAVVELMFRRLESQGHRLWESAEARRELRDLAEHVKIHLSSNPAWDEPIVVKSSKVFCDFKIDRREFDALAAPLVERAMRIIEATLRKNPTGPLRPQDVKDVVFVGGSCRIPLFRQRVARLFGREGRDTIDPMEVVALGAAYQASHAKETTDAPIVVLQSLARSLGVSHLGVDASGVMRADLFAPILAAGEKIPTRRTHVFQTIRDDQTEIVVSVFETEAERTDGLTPWDQHKITGLPGGPAGSFPIEVTFEYSVDQMLSVGVHVPGGCVNETWEIAREKQLASGRAESREKIDDAFSRSFEALAGLAARIESSLPGEATAPNSRAALLRLKAAVTERDLEAALSAKSDLASAMFEEGVPLN